MKKIVLVLSAILTIAITQSCSKDDYQENIKEQELNSKLFIPGLSDDYRYNRNCNNPTNYYVEYEGVYSQEERDLLMEEVKKRFGISSISISPQPHPDCSNKEVWPIPVCNLFAYPYNDGNDNGDTNGDSDINNPGDIVGGPVNDEGITEPPPGVGGSNSEVIMVNNLKLTIYENEFKYDSRPCSN